MTQDTVRPAGLQQFVTFRMDLFCRLALWPWAAVPMAALFPGAAVARIGVSAAFTETIITLKWDSLPDAAAYNVYADYGKGKMLLNPVPIRTRASYSLFWHKEGDEKKRIVKGNYIATWVVALKGDTCLEHADQCREDGISDTVATRYFEGYRKVRDKSQCLAVLRGEQVVAPVLEGAETVTKRDFLKQYPGAAVRIDSLYRAMVDPRDEGACVPFSTMVAKYMTANGVPCYRCNGAFITQFHSFNLVVVDGVEYILDFTADQFVPGSAPVFMPRDMCQIDSLGNPTRSTDGTVTRMYLFDKVFRADQIEFTSTPQAKAYQEILDTLMMR